MLKRSVSVRRNRLPLRPSEVKRRWAVSMLKRSVSVRHERLPPEPLVYRAEMGGVDVEA